MRYNLLTGAIIGAATVSGMAIPDIDTRDYSNEGVCKVETVTVKLTSLDHFVGHTFDLLTPEQAVQGVAEALNRTIPGGVNGPASGSVPKQSLVSYNPAQAFSTTPAAAEGTFGGYPSGTAPSVPGASGISIGVSIGGSMPAGSTETGIGGEQPPFPSGSAYSGGQGETGTGSAPLPTGMPAGSGSGGNPYDIYSSILPEISSALAGLTKSVDNPKTYSMGSGATGISTEAGTATTEAGSTGTGVGSTGTGVGSTGTGIVTSSAGASGESSAPFPIPSGGNNSTMPAGASGSTDVSAGPTSSGATTSSVASGSTGISTSSMASDSSSASSSAASSSAVSSSAVSSSGVSSSSAPISTGASSSSAASSTLSTATSSSSASSSSASASATGCANPKTRVEWRNMADSDKMGYAKAVKCLMDSPSKGIGGATTRWEDLTALHQTQSGVIHGVGQFLPWHRYFVHVQETLLRNECGYNGPLPWWDETKDAGQFAQSPVFDSKYLGSARVKTDNGLGACVTDGVLADVELHVGPGSSNTPHCLSRAIDESLSKDLTNNFIASCNAHTNYVDMQNCAFPGPHAYGHDAVGAVMSDVASSPGDPVFFLHHGMIDRAWKLWQSQGSDRTTAIGGYTTQSEPAGGWIDTTLQYSLSSLGVIDAVDIEKVMDTEGGYLCYDYDY